MTKPPPYDPMSGRKPTRAQLLQSAIDEVGCEVLRVFGGLPRLSYVAAALDGEERLARGEKQTKCATCNRYRWPHEQEKCGRFATTE